VSAQLPLESSNTLNDSWGFNIGDSNYKTPEQVQEMLVRAAGNNSNLLLNIGPMPNGEIQPEFVERLHAIGEWISRYGDSIYGTRGGPLAPGDWGVTTQKGDKIYVHVLHWDAPLLALGPIQKKITGAKELTSGAKLELTQTSDGVVLKLPVVSKGETDRVIVLTTDLAKP
jgi:alpha-L-fucosidase